MKLVDANVLLYAVNSDTKQHTVAVGWLDRALSGTETVAFTWLVLLAFLRISTHPGIFARPLAGSEALNVIEEWLDQPGSVVLEPGVRHLGVLRGLVEATTTAGNVLNDAHLAAIAVQNGAQVVSFDTDFARFAGVHLDLLR